MANPVPAPVTGNIYRRNLYDQILRYTGAWNGYTQYIPGDVVSINSGMYVCVLQTTNNQPPNTTYWSSFGVAGGSGYTMPSAPGAAGNVPRSNGTNYVDATLAAADVTNAADKSSGTLQAFTAGLSSAHSTQGIGHATGAGGTVTQATSRTTAVTLNKICGQIITFNSALAANTVQSFTVNNSTVATTDCVILTAAAVHSPDDIYFVTQVNSGNFRISYTYASGPSSAQMTFNFVVIKAVTS